MSKNRKIKLGVSAFAFALLLGCDKAEPVRDIAYYQGLGFEKSLESLRACVQKKKALLEKKDAEGLDQFAKSTQNINCRTAFRFVIKEAAQSLSVRAQEIQKMNTQDEVKILRDKIHADMETKLSGIDSVVEDWQSDAMPLGLAIRDLNQKAANRISRIDIDSWKKRK
ncbi:hypothetical protein [Noviherbaspirillum sedimenti]|uniref:Lipoprotein n=1 Tax=Noviherbaspirillum sedimenti TaxID=2320865 RepID=A0A3A3G3Z1_9BURK|nr:hypothetical protein [Noviherbaspirillum sedimenti]RJG02641.1 hypothetical protein D3878_14530 [Noviherbaspirillum sedimenti]